MGQLYVYLSEHRLSRLLFPRFFSITSGICPGSSSAACFQIPSDSLHAGHCTTRTHSKANRSLTRSRLDVEERKLPTPATCRFKSQVSPCPQALHGGLSTPRLSRRSVQEGNSSSAASGNGLDTIRETASRTLDEWKESFDNLFRESSQVYLRIKI